MIDMTLILLLLITGCNRDNEQCDTGITEYSPVIIIHFRETDVSPSLPWDISEDHTNISASMLHPDNNPAAAATSQLIREAIENDMFVALISDSCLNYQIGDDHIQIWFDSSGTVRSLPEQLLDESLDPGWLDNISHQDILLRLVDTYKPDLTVMDYRISDVSSVLRMAEYWTAPDVLSRYMVIMLCLPEDSATRGWCVFAGKGINGSTPYGLTESGLFATIRLLAGLQWMDVLPDIIPAISILKDTDMIWTDQ